MLVTVFMPYPLIKLLEPPQLDGAVALFEAQLQEHGILTSVNDLRTVAQAVVSEPRYGFILVAYLGDGSPVGVAYASCLLSLEHGGTSGWLEELYVLPQWRGRGIGSSLIEEVVARAKKLGWRAIDLEVDTHHSRAISLYGRYHFKPHFRSRFYRSIHGDSSTQ